MERAFGVRVPTPVVDAYTENRGHRPPSCSELDYPARVPFAREQEGGSSEVTSRPAHMFDDCSAVECGAAVEYRVVVG